MREKKEADAIYNFGLPGSVDARFTCVLCGAPAISELEFYDEIVCDVCYSKVKHVHEEVDDQYRYEAMCPFRNNDTPIEIDWCCDGKCGSCLL